MGCCVKGQKTTREPNATQETLPKPKRKELITILKDIRLKYEFKKVIGHGHFGTVRLATHKTRLNSQYAVKTIVKKKLKGDLSQLQREMEILYTLDHPNIIKLYAVYEDAKYFHLVTEYCSGGELFDRIVEKGHFSESEAARLMGKLFLAVNNLHANNICHRDLKPENFLFESEDPSAELKLIDFGLSNKFFDKFAGVEMHSFVGTPHYVAPEVLKGGYGTKCDMWSAGVIMYVLLSGGLPFSGESTNEVFTKILNGDLHFKAEIWSHVTRDAKDLLTNLLVLDPSKRFSAEEALEHTWFSSSPTHILRIDPIILNSLRKYKTTSKFQSEAYAIIVKHLNVSQIKALKEAFFVMDLEKNGFLSFDEIETALRRAGFNPASQEIASIIRNTDFKGDGHINYSEFIAATLDFRTALDEDALWNAFNIFDVDNSGVITHENLKEALNSAGREVSDAEVTAILSEIGIGPQGISFADFKKIIRQSGA